MHVKRRYIFVVVVFHMREQIITVFPSNAGTGMHSHQGAIMLFEVTSGMWIITPSTIPIDEFASKLL
jgi:hypothetical protein